MYKAFGRVVSVYYVLSWMVIHTFLYICSESARGDFSCRVNSSPWLSYLILNYYAIFSEKQFSLVYISHIWNSTVSTMMTDTVLALE